MTCNQCGAVGAEWLEDLATSLCEPCQELGHDEPEPKGKLKRCECCDEWRPDVEPLREPDLCFEYERNWELCEECRAEYWLMVD